MAVSPSRRLVTNPSTWVASSDHRATEILARRSGQRRQISLRQRDEPNRSVPVDGEIQLVQTARMGREIGEWLDRTTGCASFFA